MSKTAALAKVGGLSKPGKMPGHAWSIDARLCKTGSKLRGIPGSTCHKCYALKGRYVFPNVRDAMARRLDNYHDNPNWIADMVSAIRATGDKWFRIFDSGDLQDLTMLVRWVTIAQMLPDVRFWMPTREYGIVNRFVKGGGVVPDNMTIRLSNPMIGDTNPSKIDGIVASGVGKEYTCPASNQGNKCVDCRACWDKSVDVVVYKQH